MAAVTVSESEDHTLRLNDHNTLSNALPRALFIPDLAMHTHRSLQKHSAEGVRLYLSTTPSTLYSGALYNEQGVSFGPDIRCVLLLL